MQIWWEDQLLIDSPGEEDPFGFQGFFEILREDYTPRVREMLNIQTPLMRYLQAEEDFTVEGPPLTIPVRQQTREELRRQWMLEDVPEEEVPF